MIALALALVAQVDAHAQNGPHGPHPHLGATPDADVPADLRMVAVPIIAWVAEHDLVVARHRKGVCAKSETEACGFDIFDLDVHTLRAVSLKNGKERWRNDTHPLLLGELRDDARVVALITSDVAASSFALLDPATGVARSTCAVVTPDAPAVRFRSRFLDATGAFFVERAFHKNGGAPPPDVPSLLLRAAADGCTVVEGEGAAPLSWPNEDERVRYGGSGARGHIDVTIDGRTRRVVIDEQPRCRRFACQPIP